MGQTRVIVDAEGIRSGYNDTGSTIAANRFVIGATTGERQIALPGAVTDDLAGVTMAAIADNAWGDIQKSGTAVVTAGAAVAIGDRLMPTTTGKAITWTAAGGANAAVGGRAVTAAAADGDLIEVELAAPGTVRQG